MVHNTRQFPLKWRNDYWRKLCQLIGQLQPRYEWKTPTFREEKNLSCQASFPWQYSMSYELHAYASYFQRLFHTFKYEKMGQRKIFCALIMRLLLKQTFCEGLEQFYLGEIQKIDKRWSKCFEPIFIDLFNRFLVVIVTFRSITLYIREGDPITTEIVLLRAMYQL